MNKKLAGAFCYGFAQGVKAKLAYHQLQGIRPDKDDYKALVHLTPREVGEHINGMQIALQVIAKELPGSDVSAIDADLCGLAENYMSNRPLGICLNSTRWDYLVLFSHQDPELIEFVIKAMRKVGVEIDLTDILSEGPKP